MSSTVSIPANFEMELFHSGAETTPETPIRGCCGVDWGWGERTVQEETLEGLHDVELCVEDDQPEADWECVVTRVALEEVADGVEACIVDLEGIWRILAWPSDGAFPLYDLGGGCWGKGGHECVAGMS